MTENVGTGGGPVDVLGAMSSKPGEPQFWFDDGTRLFWTQRECDGRWVDLKEQAVRRRLKWLNFRDKADSAAAERLSEIDAKLMQIENERRVSYAGLLAGYKEGIHMMEGEPLLVTRSPLLVEPAKGDCAMVRGIVDGMFLGLEDAGDGAQPVEVDQREYFWGWLQHVLQCLYDGYIENGLCLAIAGDTASGKTLLAQIVKSITGADVSYPYDFMVGKDNFNKELFRATLQLVDDENAQTDIKSRLKFGAEIKKIVAKQGARCRGIHRDGLTLRPLWRLMILLNLEPDRLLVLPPIDRDIADKLMVLKAYKRTMPMPAESPAEKRAFWSAIEAQLPALVWWLLHEYKMSSSLHGRFGVKHYAHPQILAALQEFAPEIRLWQLINKAVLTRYERLEGGSTVDYPVDEWSGTAEQLEQLMKAEHSHLTNDERREVPNPNWIGHRLEALRRQFGDEVCAKKRTGTRRLWVLHRRREAAE